MGKWVDLGLKDKSGTQREASQWSGSSWSLEAGRLGSPPCLNLEEITETSYLGIK